MRALALIVVASLWAGSAPAQEAAPSGIVDPPIVGGRVMPGYAALLSELRQGGLVLLIRHERTDLSAHWDLEPYAPGDCRQQRNLSSVGRSSARALGLVLEALSIPIGAVIASPYCRAVETARRAFGRVVAESVGLIGADGQVRTDADVRADVEALIAAHAGQRTNLILVGHHGTVTPFTSRFLDEGDALILRPRRGESPEIVAHMPAARWDELLRDEQRRAAGR